MSADPPAHSEDAEIAPGKDGHLELRLNQDGPRSAAASTLATRSATPSSRATNSRCRPGGPRSATGPIRKTSSSTFATAPRPSSISIALVRRRGEAPTRTAAGLISAGRRLQGIPRSDAPPLRRDPWGRRSRGLPRLEAEADTVRRLGWRDSQARCCSDRSPGKRSRQEAAPRGLRDRERSFPRKVYVATFLRTSRLTSGSITYEASAGSGRHDARNGSTSAPFVGLSK